MKKPRRDFKVQTWLREVFTNIKIRKMLFAGGPPANKNLFAGGPPENKKLFTGGPLANKKLFAGGPPTNKKLFARGFPENKTYGSVHILRNHPLLNS